MVDLILKLIDKCIELAKRREEVTADLFENFVQPAFQDFEAVHTNYIKSFQCYRNMLIDPAVPINPLHPIFSALSEDALFSMDLRARVRALKPLQEDPLLGAFIGSMFRYLDTAAVDPAVGYETEADHQYLPGNMLRDSYENGLRALLRRQIPEEQTRRFAIENLDDLVSRIQTSYEEVVREFTQTKIALLKRV